MLINAGWAALELFPGDDNSDPEYDDTMQLVVSKPKILKD